MAARRTLLAVFNRVGDLTLSTPLFRALARDSSLSLLTRPFGPALLGAQSFVDRVYTLDYPNRGASRIGRVLLGGHRRSVGRQLGAAGFDRVLIYEAERGVIRDWLNDLFPGRVHEMVHVLEQGEHVSDLYRRAAGALGCDMDAYDPLPHLEVAPGDRERARERLESAGERVVGLQMGSQRTHTIWPLVPRPHLKALTVGQWAGLVGRLLDSGDADAVACHGSARERKMAAALREALTPAQRERCHDFTDVGLDLLPAVLQNERALISLDTGPAHIAAAVGCPLLVFFGPTDPQRYAPRGRGPIEILVGSAPCQFCHGTPAYGACRDNICLNKLSDDQIWEAWRRLDDSLP